MLIICQVFAALLDVIALVLIGILTIRLSQGNTKESSLSQILLNISENQNTQNIFLAVTTAFLFILKTLLSLMLNNITTETLSNEADRVSQALLKRTFFSQYKWLKDQNEDNLIYSINQGPNTVANGLLGTLITLTIDIFLITLIIGTLSFYNLQITAILMCINFLLFLLVFPVLHKKNNHVGKRYSQTLIETQENIKNLIRSYREIYVSRKETFFLDSYKKNKIINSEMYVQNVNSLNGIRTVIEIALIASTLIFLASQVVIGTSQSIFSTIVFLIGALRVAPSIIRIQSNIVMIKYHLGRSTTYSLLTQQLDLMETSNKLRFNSATKTTDKIPTAIEIIDLSFSYSEEISSKTKKINTYIPREAKVAIWGASGSGKTTFLEMLVGLLPPTSGYINFIHTSSKEEVNLEQLNMSYVPQNPFFFPGTIEENITFENVGPQIDIPKLNHIVEITQLREVLQENDYDFQTSSLGLEISLSSGEKQRLALSRALYNEPTILILDEALNAVSEQMEFQIINNLLDNYKSMTLLYVTHRQNSLNLFDYILDFSSETVTLIDIANWKMGEEK